MQPRPGGADEPSDRAGPSRSGLGSRRVVWSAFGVSIAIHLLAVILYPLMFERMGVSGPLFAPPVTTGPPQGAQVIRLIDIDESPEPSQPDDPEEIEEIVDPTPDTQAPTFEGPVIEVGPPGPGPADRLRVRLVDARLWRTPPPEFFELTLEQREELILQNRIVEWFDSVQGAQAAEDRLTDWTVTDGDGGRWGISPGRIHLGSITLPLPLGFGVAVGKRDETNQLIWQWEEIMRQAARAEIELTWQERSEAIRARRDRERAAVDTTRGR